MGRVVAYAVAFQLLCGSFAAFLAGRKGRSRIAWFAVGLLVPIIGVALAWSAAPRAAGPKAKRRDRAPGAQRQRRRPRRCTGSYIPDCLGCRYFIRPLFDPSYSGFRKGRCELLGRDLVDEAERESSKPASEGQ